MYRSSPYDRSNLIADFDSIRISLAAPEKIRSWSHGEVTKPRRSTTAPSSRSGTDCSARASSAHPGLGVPVRQVQADEAPRGDLRQVRRGSHAGPGAARAPRPHRTGQPLFPRLVFQGPAQPHRVPAGHYPSRTGAGPVFRGVRGGRSRRSAGPLQGRGDQRRTQATARPGASRQVRGDDGSEGIKELSRGSTSKRSAWRFARR